MKSSAVWATSSQPWSMVRAWPRFGIPTKLRDGPVAPLPLVGGVRDRPRYRVVLLALDDEQRSAVGILRAALRLRPRIEVRVAHLHERDPGAGDVVRVVELPRLLLVQGVRPART